MSERTMTVRFQADTRDFDRKTDEAGRSLGGFGRQSEETSKKTRGGFTVMKGAVASFAGSAALQLGQKALSSVADFAAGTVNAASELSETLNKSDAIFGDQSRVIRDWAKTASTSFGLSQEQALAYASQLGDMGRQLGLTSRDAAGFSKDLVGVAADLGSFNNLETGDVLDRINAAMRGEYDSLQALIPNINAARVEQEALAATGKKSAKELTAQEKALAVQAILHKDGARAMGDFAKTSGGFANQQKILQAQLADVQAELGQALLPILQQVIQFVTSTAVPAIASFAEWFSRDLVPQIQAFGAQLAGVWPVVQSVFGFIADNLPTIAPLAGIVLGVVAAIKAWTAVQAALNVVMSANPIGLVVIAIGALVAALIYAYQNSETFRNIVNGAFNAVKTVVLTVGNAVIGAIKAVVDWLVSAWKSAVDFGVRVVRAFNQVNAQAVAAIRGMVNSVVNFFRNLFSTSVRIATDLRDRFIRANQNLRDGVVRVISNTVSRVVGFFTNLRDTTVRVILTLRDRVFSGFRSLRDGAINIVNQIRSWITDRFQSLVNTTVRVILTLRDRVFSGFRSLRDGALTIVTQMRNWVVDRANSLRTRVVDAVWRVRDGALKPFRSLRDVGVKIFTGFRNTIGRVMGGILDRIKSPLRSAFSWLNRNLIRPLDSVTSKFGLNIPELPKLHSGGYVGGKGERPYMLLGGEGVLNPRATKALGGKKGVDMLNAGGPGDWLRNFTEFIGTPAKLVAQMAQRGVKWAINQVLGAIPNLPGTGVPMVDMIPGILNSVKSKITSWAGKTEREQQAALGSDVGGSIGSGPWVKPVAAGIGNGYLGYPGHYGVDFPVGTGTPVHAVSNGIITKAASLTYSYGRHLFARHADGLVTVYAHLSQLLASAGQAVRTGQVIGRSGSTGNSTGPHLHFETRVGGGYPGPNPRGVMAARGVTLDTGGMLQPGHTLVYNGTGGPEPVLTGRQWRDIRAASGNGGGSTVINIYGPIDKASTAREIRKVLSEDERRFGGVRVNQRTASR